MRLRCLIVDDHAPFVAAARALLEDGEISVVGAASTASEAVRLAAELDPDFVLLDVELRGESGFEVARRLAGTLEARRVILVSTHSEEDLSEMVADAPVAGFLPKARIAADAICDLLAGAA